jgi:hypothetical protein
MADMASSGSDRKAHGSFGNAVEENLQIISIAPSRASWVAALNAESCRSQALRFFINRINFLVELHDLRVFWRIGAAQLIEHFANGEFSYFSHRKLLCAWEDLLAATSTHFDTAQIDIAQSASYFSRPLARLPYQGQIAMSATE